MPLEGHAPNEGFRADNSASATSMQGELLRPSDVRYHSNYQVKPANREAMVAMSQAQTGPNYTQLDPRVVGAAQKGFDIASTLASGTREGTGSIFSRGLGLLKNGFANSQKGTAGGFVNGAGMAIMGLFTAVLGIDAIKTLFSKEENGKSKWGKLIYEGFIALFAGNITRNFYEILNGATYNSQKFMRKIGWFLAAKFGLYDAAFSEGSIANKLLGWAIKDSKGNNRLENILTLNFDSNS